MGESKRRVKLSQRIRLEQPLCIFCGGEASSETVDHYPPRIVFDGKQRPRGLEFGACKVCNEGSRQADLIAATFSRMLPESQTDEERQEVGRLIRAVLRIPGFASEVYPERDQLGTLLSMGSVATQLPSWNFLRIRGPIVHNAMRVFGAKLGFAMHMATTGRIVPKGGGAFPIWYSNLQAYQGKLPAEFIELLGPGKTLRQGNFDVAKQFRIASIVDQERLSAHFAVFRESFAILVFVAESISDLDNAEEAIQPGFLKHQTSLTPPPARNPRTGPRS